MCHRKTSAFAGRSPKLLGLVVLVLQLLWTGQAQASQIIFQDDFSDNDLSEWSFTSGQNWFVNASGELQTNRVSSGFEFASVNGLSTPDNFRLEVDIRNIIGASNKPSEQGHGGVFWDQAARSGIDENKAYVRTHGDHLNLYTVGQGETQSTLVADNGDTLRYILDVDYTARELLLSAEVIGGARHGNYAEITLSGMDFEQRVLFPNAGGGLGLLTWGDSVAFDNLVIYSNVPTPDSLLVLLMGIGLFSLGKARRRQSV